MSDRAGGGAAPGEDLDLHCAQAGWRSPALGLGEMGCRGPSEWADARALRGSGFVFSAPQITGSWGSLKMNMSLRSPPSCGSIHPPSLAQAHWAPLYLLHKVWETHWSVQDREKPQRPQTVPEGRAVEVTTSSLGPTDRSLRVNKLWDMPNGTLQS